MRFKLHLFFIFTSLLIEQQSYAIFPINYLRPYDELFYRVSEGTAFELYTVAEYGFKPQGRNEEGDKVEQFQLWQNDQSTLAMLKGFSPNSKIGSLSQRFNIDDDDGTRGHLIPHANVEFTSAVVSARYYLPYDFSLSAHLPIYSIAIDKVAWQDMTQDVTSEDKLVHEDLTNKIASLVHQLGNLDIGPWQDQGVGDLVLAARWHKQYPQIKPLLRTVAVTTRAGLSLPTAKNQHRDRAFAIPFGNDGSTGVFIGGGIDLTWEHHLRAGIDVEFLHLFGSTQYRRIKTDPHQGDILLLQKALVRRDFGITQRYNLFLELNRFLQGFSLRTTYQFWQHGEDSLSLFTNDFSSSVANTSFALEDWSMHQLIFSLIYDTAANLEDDAPCKPQFTFYYKIPINGSHALLAHAFGGAIVFNF